jgi:hypothetical protein
MAQIGFSGVMGKMIGEKNLKSIISCQTPFRVVNNENQGTSGKWQMFCSEVIFLVPDWAGGRK